MALQKVLSFFLSNTGRGKLLKEIVGALRIPEREIINSIEYWNKAGYVIQFHPQLGYELVESPDIINPVEVAYRLPNNPFAQKLKYFESIDSTNNLAMKLGETSPEGTSIVAGMQTSGKGRHGRNWESSNSKGLYLSMVFKPDWAMEQATRLVTITSIAACRALEKSASIKVSLKWPNDLLIKNLKLGGILTEARTKAGRIHFVVVGIGININQLASDFSSEIKNKSTSLAMAIGRQVRRMDILTAMLQEIHAAYHAPFPPLAEEWESRCVSIGQNIQVREGKDVFSGIMAGLDEEGSLLLRLDHARIRTVRSGEILFH